MTATVLLIEKNMTRIGRESLDKKKLIQKIKRNHKLLRLIEIYWDKYPGMCLNDLVFSLVGNLAYRYDDDCIEEILLRKLQEES